MPLTIFPLIAAKSLSPCVRESSTAFQSIPGCFAGTAALLGGDLVSRKDRTRCANPACPTRFRWNAGKRFFRSRSEPGHQSRPEETADLQSDRPRVEHYWLCELCSHLFTQYGVVLKVIERPHPDVSTQAILKAA